MFDANFSMARILKPFPNFEAVYQGASALFPIAFPGTLDRQAGEPGYDPNLLSMLPVPLGSRVMIWIPLTIFNDDQGTFNQQTYQYQVLWRMRSIGDFQAAFQKNVPRDEIGSYHLRQRDIGVPNDPANPQSTVRIVLPAAMQVIAYEQAEPTTTPSTYVNGTIHLRGQQIIPDGAIWAGPLLPPPAANTVHGIIGQGIFPFTSGASDQGELGGPVFFPFWFDAEGDEMMVLARRVSVTEQDPNWDFASPTVDQPFSATYGTNNGTRAPVPSVGIFVFTGSAP